MRLPWARGADADPDAGNDDGQGSYDDEPTGEGEGDGEGDQDPLEGLDDDVRQRAEAYADRIRKEEQAKFARARGALQAAGLDVVEDKLVGDPQKFASWAMPAGQQVAGPTAAASAESDADADEPWPDPAYEKEAFEKRLAKHVEASTAKARAESQSVVSTMHGYLLDDAVNRVGDALERINPLLAPLMEHPEFEKAFRDGLVQSDPSRWRDPVYLAQIAGAIAPQLTQGWTPPRRPTQQRDEEGRFVPNQNQGGRGSYDRPGTGQPRGSYDRANLQQISHAPATGRGGRPQYNDVDRITAERLGIPIEAAVALQDETGEAYRQAMARHKARGNR